MIAHILLLLTAWSTAGILGPGLVNYIREYQIARGVAPADAYTFTMYVLVGFLGVPHALGGQVGGQARRRGGRVVDGHRDRPVQAVVEVPLDRVAHAEQVL